MRWSLILLFAACAGPSNETPDSSTASTIDAAAPHLDATPSPDALVSDELQVIAQPDGSFVCIPAGPGSFPTALYNHGGVGPSLGGDLEGTCRALAEAGWIAMAKRRTTDPDWSLNLQDVRDGLEAITSHPRAVEPVAVIGFSRGSMLTLTLTTEQPVDKLVLLAIAGRGGPVDEMLDLSLVPSPLLMLSVENDVQAPPDQSEPNVLEPLQAAGKQVHYIRYPEWPGAIDGHELFWEVRDEYWPDVLDYLEGNTP